MKHKYNHCCECSECTGYELMLKFRTKKEDLKKKGLTAEFLYLCLPESKL